MCLGCLACVGSFVRTSRSFLGGLVDEMGCFRVKYCLPAQSIALVDQKSYNLFCGSTSFIGATIPCLVITLFYFRMYYVLCIKARSNVHAVTSFLFGIFSLIYSVDIYSDFVW